MPAYNQQAINLLANELTSRGVKPQVAAGAIAGIMGESGANLSPTAFNSQDPHGGAGGILQWNNERLIGPSGLLAYAKANGVNVDTSMPTDSKKVPLALQVKFMGHELDGSHNGVLQGLKSANTGADGLRTWVNTMEVPADKAGAIAQRSQYVGPVTGMLGAPAPPVTGATPPGTAKPTDTAANSYAPSSPEALLSSSLGQELGGMSVPSTVRSGGGGEMDTPDQPSTPSMAAQTDFIQPHNPIPAQFAGGGVPAQLGALAAQPNTPSLEDPNASPSITAGAPSMTGMIGDLGTTASPGAFDQRAGSQLSPNPGRRATRLA